MRNAPTGAWLDTASLIAASVTRCESLAVEIARSRALVDHSREMRLARYVRFPFGRPIAGGSNLPKATESEPQRSCPVCGGTIASGDVLIFHGDLIHVDCWRSRPVPRRPPTSAPARPTALIMEAIAKGGCCLDCVVGQTQLPMRTVAGSLRRLGDGVNITVGLCSTCGNNDRLLCGLAG